MGPSIICLMLNEKYNLLGTLYDITVSLDYLERAISLQLSCPSVILGVTTWRVTAMLFPQILA